MHPSLYTHKIYVASRIYAILALSSNSAFSSAGKNESTKTFSHLHNKSLVFSLATTAMKWPGRMLRNYPPTINYFGAPPAHHTHVRAPSPLPYVFSPLWRPEATSRIATTNCTVAGKPLKPTKVAFKYE